MKRTSREQMNCGKRLRNLDQAMLTSVLVLNISPEMESRREHSLAKTVQHFEIAAMQGHILSRTKLGVIYYSEGDYESAIRHLMISAKVGFGLNVIQLMFAEGQASEQQYAEALTRTP